MVYIRSVVMGAISVIAVRLAVAARLGTGGTSTRRTTTILTGDVWLVHTGVSSVSFNRRSTAIIGGAATAIGNIVFVRTCRIGVNVALRCVAAAITPPFKSTSPFNRPLRNVSSDRSACRRLAAISCSVCTAINCAT